MAFTAGSILEVRGATGSDTNGGGYGSGGTDWSQQASPQYSVTDGITAGTTTITSATAAFGTDVVGNFISVSGGTGTLAQVWRQIVSRTNATTIVVDATTGLGASTGVTLKIGGALATAATAIALMSTSNMTTYIKNDGTYLITAQLIPPPSSIQQVIGYTTTRGDNGIALFQSNSTAFTMLAHNAAITCSWVNMQVDGNSAATMVGVNVTAAGASFENFKVKNCPSKGVVWTTQFYARQMEVFNCSGTNSACDPGTTATAAIFVDCWIHGNSKPGIGGSAGGTYIIKRSMINGNTGDGLTNFSPSSLATGNVIYNNTGNGVTLSSTAAGMRAECSNNIIAKNGGFGIVGVTAAPLLPVGIHHNGFYSNTSGDVSNLTIDSTSVAQSALTANPFTGVEANLLAGTSTDFSLNNNNPGGAQLRNVGQPGTITGLSPTGYADIGLFRHQDPAGSAGMLFRQNLDAA